MAIMRVRKFSSRPSSREAALFASGGSLSVASLANGAAAAGNGSMGAGATRFRSFERPRKRGNIFRRRGHDLNGLIHDFSGLVADGKYLLEERGIRSEARAACRSTQSRQGRGLSV